MGLFRQEETELQGRPTGRLSGRQSQYFPSGVSQEFESELKAEMGSLEWIEGEILSQ